MTFTKKQILNYNLKTFRPGWINNRLKKIARQSHDRTKDEELDLTLECCTQPSMLLVKIGHASLSATHPLNGYLKSNRAKLDKNVMKEANFKNFDFKILII